MTENQLLKARVAELEGALQVAGRQTSEPIIVERYIIDDDGRMHVEGPNYQPKSPPAGLSEETIRRLNAQDLEMGANPKSEPPISAAAREAAATCGEYEAIGYATQQFMEEAREGERQRPGAQGASGDVQENFERAFSSHGGGCRRECKCGRAFYNPDDSWTWDEGEIEALEAAGATPLKWTVSTILIAGVEYVCDCDCWLPMAEKMVAWIDNHAEALADFLTLEKRRKQKEADRSPVVT